MYVVHLADAPQKPAVAAPPPTAAAAAVLTLGFVADDLHSFIHY